jgi:hypothetical protein
MNTQPIDPEDARRAAHGRRQSSLTALEQIYYVIAGLALTNAITTGTTMLNGEGNSSSSTDSKIIAACMLLGFVFTLVRFVQGAATHFGSHKKEHAVDARGRYEALQPLLDFLSFGLQASLFVVLASEFNKSDLFMYAFLVLLVSDAVWIKLTILFDIDVKQNQLIKSVLQQWVWSNVVLGIVLAIFWFLVFDAPIWRAVAFACCSLIAFLVDYWCNREYYFGTRGKQ